jgi:hypothetical protein
LYLFSGHYGSHPQDIPPLDAPGGLLGTVIHCRFASTVVISTNDEVEQAFSLNNGPEASRLDNFVETVGLYNVRHDNGLLLAALGRAGKALRIFRALPSDRVLVTMS